MKDIYRDYLNATPEERYALEQKYGKIFNRLMDEMASMETIRSTARQCPSCTIFVDVNLFLTLTLSPSIFFLLEIGWLQ